MFFWIIYHLAVVIYKGFYNIKVEGKENIPKGAFIIASNHRSYADPPVIAIGAGYSRYSFIAKEELFKNPLAGWFIGKLGAFPVARGKGDMGAVDNAAQKLRENRRLVIFPEGTRSKDGKIGRGKTGVALIAAKSGYPVVPAGIIFEGKLRFRSTILVRYGKPIDPSEFSLGSDPKPHELKAVKGMIMGAITELVEGADENGSN